MYGGLDHSMWLWTLHVVAASIAYSLTATVLHEAFHAAAAIALGHSCSLRVRLEYTCVCVPKIPQGHARIVRHTGWVASCALALLVVTFASSFVASAAFSFVAAEAVASDLIGLVALEARSFACGNFGVIALRALNRRHVLPILRMMMTTTMVRGAQSAGIVRRAASPTTPPRLARI